MTPGERPIYEQIGPGLRGLITVVVMTGSFMAILDTTVVDVVVPRMMAPLSTDLYGIQWVITAYMTAAAVGLLLTHKLGSVWGLKRLFLTGLTVFTLASMLCGVAQSLPAMIASRVIQGLGEAFIMASAQTILFSIYPPQKRGLAMGIYALGVSFAPSLGPTIGGWITQHLSWRWVFYVNFPVGILNLVAGLSFLPIVQKHHASLRFNFLSYTFLAAFTISLLVLLSKGQQLGWLQSTLINYLILAAVASLLLYLISEIISKQKLIDFSIFRIREYGFSMGFYFLVLGFSMYQIFYLLPLYYENLKHLTTFDTGLHMLAFAIFIAIFSPVAGYLSDRIGEKKVLSASLFLYLITNFLLIPSLNYYTPSVRAALLTLPFGISIGMFFAPVSTLALRNLEEKTALGVSLMHYLRFVGGSFGTAIATNTLERQAALHYDEISAMQNTTHLRSVIENTASRISVLFPEPAATHKAKAVIAYAQSLQSLSYAFQDTFYASAYYALAGGIFLIPLMWKGTKKATITVPSVLKR